MTVTTSLTAELRRQWRRQLAGRLATDATTSRRGFVAVTFLDHANTSQVFVDISKLSVVLMYDDFCRHQRVPLRFCSFGVSRVPHGVQWGSADNSQLFKDLTLAPKPGARGQRFDIRKGELVALALKLDRRLSRAARYPAAPWPALRLPQLWAGFPRGYSAYVQGEGPEFEEALRSKKANSNDLLASSTRRIDGLHLYPIDWVSGQLERAAAVFAEVTMRFRRQVFRVDALPDDLVGFSGAAAFDFYSSRFRSALPSAVATGESQQLMRHPRQVQFRRRAIA